MFDTYPLPAISNDSQYQAPAAPAELTLLSGNADQPDKAGDGGGRRTSTAVVVPSENAESEVEEVENDEDEGDGMSQRGPNNMVDFPFLAPHADPDMTRRGIAQCVICSSPLKWRRINAVQEHLAGRRHRHTTIKINQRLQLFPWLQLGGGSSFCLLCGEEEEGTGAAAVPWRNLQRLRDHQESRQHREWAEAVGGQIEPSRLTNEGRLVAAGCEATSCDSEADRPGLPPPPFGSVQLSDLVKAESGPELDKILIKNQDLGGCIAGELLNLRTFDQGSNANKHRYGYGSNAIKHTGMVTVAMPLSISLR